VIGARVGIVMKLIRIVKNWDQPDVLRQTPGGEGIWNGLQFTVGPVQECDYLIILNYCPMRVLEVLCPKENVWAIMQEPYMKGLTDWMAEKHEHFSKVFTHHPPSEDPKYTVSHPSIPWHVNKTFDELEKAEIPEKRHHVSWVVGDAKDLPGHMKRWRFLKYIQENNIVYIDLYGRAVRFIEDKWDALAPYRFSLAVENTSRVDYWTEKVADCFLTWTVPIYYGCPNLEDYFPEKSFFRIDIDKAAESMRAIRDIISENNWKERLPALEEARNLVLHRYQLFPHVAQLIREYGTEKAEKHAISIPEYRRSAIARFYRLRYKARRETGKFWGRMFAL